MGFFSGILDAVGDFFDPVTSVVKDVFGAVTDVGKEAIGLGKDVASAASAFQPIINTGTSVYAADRAYQGQQETNEANMSLMREQDAFSAQQADLARQFNASQGDISRQFNMSEAQKQRDWTEQMSNSQWQRAVGDLSAAGLNPMLAYSKGGNAFGGGATASSGSVSGPSASPGGLARVESPAGAAIAAFSSAAGIRKTLAELDNIAASSEKMRAEAGTARAQTTRIMESDIALGNSQTQLNSAHVVESRQRTANMVQDMVKVMAEIDRIPELNTLTRAEVAKLKQDTIRSALEGTNIQAHTGNLVLDAKLKELELPRANNLSAAEQTWWKQHLAPFLHDLPIIGSFRLPDFRTTSPRGYGPSGEGRYGR